MNTVNTMIGSTTLIVPVIFSEIGIVTGIMACFLLCLVNFLTADLLLRHGKSSEDDLPEMINRILGYKYY